MNIVFLHCHFERGGVTQVVENQVAAISERIDGRILLVSGKRQSGLSAATLDLAETLVIESLDYDAVGDCDSNALSIAADLATALDEHGFFADQTVLHWHNHSLGKNVALPEVIDPMLEHLGFKQLLQIHDFAEDYRPGNFQLLMQRTLVPGCPRSTNVARYCLPINSSIDYATLTRADAQVLHQAGVPAKQTHLLPNSVSLGAGALPDRNRSLDKIRNAANLPGDARWCLYPVRGIRRKNVGELLLLSRLLPENMFAGVTLPPATDIERDSYERWREIGQQCAPRLVFDAGMLEDVSFTENLAASDFVISTSVAEGFGMAYLEPWLAARGVIARRLPNVVDDFVESGVRLDRFYDSIAIPGERQWIATCRQETKHAFDQAWSVLPLNVRPQIRDNADEPSDWVDFACLTTQRQIEVLRRMESDRGFETEIASLNPSLVQWMKTPFEPATLSHNADQIRKHYSIDVAGERLMEVYRGLLSEHHSPSASQSRPTSESLLDLICSQRPYYPCRTETEISR